MRTSVAHRALRSSASIFRPIEGPSYVELEERKTRIGCMAFACRNLATTSAMALSACLWLMKTSGSVKSSPEKDSLNRMKGGCENIYHQPRLRAREFAFLGIFE